MKWALLIGGLWLLFSARQVDSAAMPVIDVAAIAQITMGVVETSKLVGLNVRDLAILANVGLLTDMVQHVIVLMQQVENERRLIVEILALWGVLEQEGMDICTVEARREWLFQAVHVNHRRITGTMRNTVALVEQTAEILQTMAQMAQLWSAITGSVAGLQVIAAMQARGNAYLASIDTALRSQAIAQVSDQIIETTDAVMMDCIMQASLADWGTVAPR